MCRYRPRGVSKEDETWDAWWPELGPSKQLHAAYYGKDGAGGIAWEAYRERYLAEVKRETWRIDGLARKVAAGETVTLLCSSACTDAARCHRALLKDVIAVAAERLP